VVEVGAGEAGAAEVMVGVGTEEMEEAVKVEEEEVVLEKVGVGLA
jgi:hypothetical protein